MKSVLVTRAPDEAAALTAALEREGFDVHACPLVETQPLEGADVDASEFSWVVFTSRAGVRHGLPRLTGSIEKVAAVGPGTAAVLEERGVDVDLVPPVHSQRGLVDALGPDCGTALFVGAEQAGRELVERCGARHVVVYRTVELSPARIPDADLAVIASGSAARALGRRRTDIPCATIGPSTSAEARSSGLRVLGEAASSDLDGLVEAVRGVVSRLP